jgi:hypothetical protein
VLTTKLAFIIAFRRFPSYEWSIDPRPESRQDRLGEEVMDTSFFAILLASWTMPCLGQEEDRSAREGGMDPIALEILKAATDPIRDAKSYSFAAVVSGEHLATNDQTITLFHMIQVTVQRPDKLKINFREQGNDVQFVFNAGQCVLYTPQAGPHSPLGFLKTVEAALDDLQELDVSLPVLYFLANDPYQHLTHDLSSGYVVGRAMIMNQRVYHLVFAGPGTEWQLWVLRGESPRVRRLEMVDNSKPERPRIVVDFLDWDLQATPEPNLFTFNKPTEAREIGQ